MIFEWVDRHGLPLDIVITTYQKKFPKVPLVNWFATFTLEAFRAGWKIKTIKFHIREAMTVVRPASTVLEMWLNASDDQCHYRLGVVNELSQTVRR